MLYSYFMKLFFLLLARKRSPEKDTAVTHRLSQWLEIVDSSEATFVDYNTYSKKIAQNTDQQPLFECANAHSTVKYVREFRTFAHIVVLFVRYDEYIYRS